MRIEEPPPPISPTAKTIFESDCKRIARNSWRTQRLISFLIKILALIYSVDYEPVVWVDVLISWLFVADTLQTHSQRQR